MDIVTKCTQDAEYFIPSSEDTAQLENIDNAYTQISEMSFEERTFLNGLILRYKPKKLLELGVSAGSSSIIILNAIKNISGAQLYSIDYNDDWYRDQTKKTGFFVDLYPELKTKWKLFTGALSLRFMDEIGEGIDFAFIDTAHANPGEILDFLMVLPFLNENAITVFHDVNLQTMHSKAACVSNFYGETNNLLISAILGKKILQGVFSIDSPYNNTDMIPHFPNIAAIELNAETRKHIFEVFNLLTLKWGYLPKQNEEIEVLAFFARFYDQRFVEYIKEVFAYHKECFRYDSENKMPLKEVYKNAMHLTKIAIKNRIKKILGKNICNKIKHLKKGIKHNAKKTG